MLLTSKTEDKWWDQSSCSILHFDDYISLWWSKYAQRCVLLLWKHSGSFLNFRCCCSDFQRKIRLQWGGWRVKCQCCIRVYRLPSEFYEIECAITPSIRSRISIRCNGTRVIVRIHTQWCVTVKTAVVFIKACVTKTDGLCLRKCFCNYNKEQCLWMMWDGSAWPGQCLLFFP